MKHNHNAIIMIFANHKVTVIMNIMIEIILGYLPGFYEYADYKLLKIS